MQQVADRVIHHNTGFAIPVRSIKSITIAVAAICMVVTLWTKPMSLKVDLPMEALLALFAKLIAIALFVERTVEVLLTPWRGLESHRMMARVKQAKAKAAKGEVDSVAVSNAEEALTEFKDYTRRIAFLMALALGMTISAVGFRGLEFFVDPKSIHEPSEQLIAFRVLDVLVTGALLAGKADGLHRMVSVFTSQLDKSTERVKSA
jgi:hypothetical protein